jgi:hypothetical protein
MLQNVGINVTYQTVREGVWLIELATNNITPRVEGKMMAVVTSTPEGKAYTSTTANSTTIANWTEEYATFLTHNYLRNWILKYCP